MMLKIADREKFLNNFLIPLSKISDSAVVKIDKEKITSLVSTSDNTVIVFSEYIESENISFKTLNIPDLKKLCRVISCIEEKSIELDISSNFIGYKSSNVRFKYYLFDDNIISSPKLNIDKLKAFEFDGKFSFTYNSLLGLIKGSSITTETNKVYLSVKDNIVYGELTDKMRPNVDSYGINISSSYEGTQFAVPVPLNFEVFRIISSMRFNEINSQIITKLGVVTFDLTFDIAKFKFIISALAN
jgi:hypothetical protein